MERERKLAGNIAKGKKLEDNIPIYANTLINEYNQFGMIELAMEYYTLFEIIKDKENPYIAQLKDEIGELNTAVYEGIVAVSGQSALDKLTDRLGKMRKSFLDKMSELTYYADCMEIYGYILDRIQGKVKDMGEEEIPDEQKFAAEVIHYIFHTKDNVVTNERIKEVIQQLPFRMTKSRYFEIVKDSIRLYKGAELSALKSYLYLFRTSAMLGKRKEKVYFKDLEKCVELLEAQDYNEITEEQYDTFSKELETSLKFIEQAQDAYMILQEIVNHLYGVLLCALEEADMDNPNVLVSKEIIASLHKELKQGTPEHIPEKSRNAVVLLEGEQEKLSGQCTVLEGVLFQIKDSYEKVVTELNLAGRFEKLYQIQKLYTSSLFVDLDNMEAEGIASEEDVNKAADELVRDMSEAFQKQSRWLRRAVMAHTTYAMPVFFNTPDEVSGYIVAALEQCHDKAEKAASCRLIREIMEY